MSTLCLTGYLFLFCLQPVFGAIFPKNHITIYWTHDHEPRSEFALCLSCILNFIVENIPTPTVLWTLLFAQYKTQHCKKYDRPVLLHQSNPMLSTALNGNVSSTRWSVTASVTSFHCFVLLSCFLPTGFIALASDRFLCLYWPEWHTVSMLLWMLPFFSWFKKNLSYYLQNPQTLPVKLFFGHFACHLPCCWLIMNCFSNESCEKETPNSSNQHSHLVANLSVGLWMYCSIDPCLRGDISPYLGFTWKCDHGRLEV